MESQEFAGDAGGRSLSAFDCSVECVELVSAKCIVPPPLLVYVTRVSIAVWVLLMSEPPTLLTEFHPGCFS